MEPLFQGWPRFLGIHGGRGGAKSWTFAEIALARMVKNQNLSIVCVREVQKSLDQSVKRLLEQKIEQHRLEDYFDVKSTQIRAKRGSGLVIFQGLSDHTAESIKSLEGYDIAWIDEAQAIKKRSLDILRPTIRKPNSQIWASWNPINETDPIDVLLRGPNKVADSVVVHANYVDNPWCPESLLAEARYDQRTDPEKYAHVWLGDYLKFSEARVFKNWRVEEFDTPPDAILRFGVDWGFSPDPTVLLRGFIVGRQLFIDYEAYEVECEIEDTPALFLTVPQSEIWTLACASDRPERVKSIRRAGFKAHSVLREQHSVEEGVEFLRGFQIIIHPRCKRTAAEMRLYSRKIDPLTNKVLPVLEDKNNHCIDAMRYMVDEVRRVGRAQVGTSDIAPPPIAQRWSR
jgi:phage terminase large subunit